MATPSSADRARAVELCERDFESVLERMIQLNLDSPQGINGSIDLNDAADRLDVLPQPAAEDNHQTGPSGSSCSSGTATSGTEWVEILVGEMASAASMDDAMCRAARILEAFQGSVAARVIGDRELVLGEQNAILKKAVVVQHRRHLEDEAKGKELQGQVADYRERIRLLELDNYAMSMRLRATQAGGSCLGASTQRFSEQRTRTPSKPLGQKC